jgi:hypothetical protein
MHSWKVKCQCKKEDLVKIDNELTREDFGKGVIFIFGFTKYASKKILGPTHWMLIRMFPWYGVDKT